MKKDDSLEPLQTHCLLSGASAPVSAPRTDGHTSDLLSGPCSHHSLCIRALTSPSPPVLGPSRSSSGHFPRSPGRSSHPPLKSVQTSTALFTLHWDDLPGLPAVHSAVDTSGTGTRSQLFFVKAAPNTTPGTRVFI